MNADDHYVVISADCHGGGEIHELPRLPRVAVPRRLRRVGRRRSRSPTTTSLGDRRRAQLGLRPAAARARGRRHRRRGDLPEHDPAVLPRWLARHAAARRPTRATSTCAGPGCRRTTAGSPTSARGTPGRRAGIAQIMLHDVDAAVEEIQLGEGERAHRRHPAPGRAARRRASPPLYAPDYEPIWHGVRGARHAGQPPQRQRASRRWARSSRRHRDVPARGHVVGAPRALAPHLRRRARASPRPAVRVHRAGHRVGARAARPARLLLRPHAHRGRARRSASGACPSSRSCR